MPERKRVRKRRGAPSRPMIYLKWIDSHHLSGWTPHEDHQPSSKDDMFCETVGFLYHESDLCYEIAQSQHPGEYDNLMVIPKVNVELVYELQRKSSRRQKPEDGRDYRA